MYYDYGIKINSASLTRLVSFNILSKISEISEFSKEKTKFIAAYGFAVELAQYTLLLF